MRILGNIIWFIIGGWWLSLLWLAAAVVTAISIIGLPLTRASWEMAKMSAFPFGKEVIHVRDLEGEGAFDVLTGPLGFIVNVIWVVTFGIGLFFSYLMAGIVACLFIVTIPFGLQCFKLAALSFWPVGRRVVPIEVAQEAHRRNAHVRLDRLRGPGTRLSA